MKQIYFNLSGILFDKEIQSSAASATTFPFTEITGLFAYNKAAAATFSAKSAGGIVISPRR